MVVLICSLALENVSKATNPTMIFLTVVVCKIHAKQMCTYGSLNRHWDLGLHVLSADMGGVT